MLFALHHHEATYRSQRGILPSALYFCFCSLPLFFGGLVGECIRLQSATSKPPSAFRHLKCPLSVTGIVTVLYARSPLSPS